MRRAALSIIFSLLVVFVAAPVIVFAQSQVNLSSTVSAEIPGSNQPTVVEGAPGGVIANFYQFALLIGGILAFGAVVYGGVLYLVSAGNPSRQGEGKEWIESALIGLALLAGAYIILDIVNPALLNLTLPTLQPINIFATNPGNAVTGGAGGSGTNPNAGRCVAPDTGPCSLAQLGNSCLGGNAAMAAAICNEESGANTYAQGDQCADGNHVSIGLFQINISAARITNANGQVLNCPAAFNHSFTSADVSNPTCQVVNQALYQQCVQAMMDPATNLANTCADSSNGNNWQYWKGSCF